MLSLPCVSSILAFYKPFDTRLFWVLPKWRLKPTLELSWEIHKFMSFLCFHFCCLMKCWNRALVGNDCHNNWNHFLTFWHILSKSWTSLSYHYCICFIYQRWAITQITFYQFLRGLFEFQAARTRIVLRLCSVDYIFPLSFKINLKKETKTLWKNYILI